jgi:hypothetical protein
MLPVDAAGRFALGPDQLPVRRTWDLADVERVRITRRVPPGHEVVVESGLGGEERTAATRLFLPFGVR